MQVGDLVRVLVDWGKMGTVGVVVGVKRGRGFGNIAILLHNGWEYHPHELEVVSASR